MGDILFKTDEHVFSYRVAGIMIQNGSVLLQKPSNDPGYAFPGGHVGFGETNEETLIREFREELAAEITVNGLRWVGEIFFPWGSRPCHQICLYYEVSLKDESQLPLDRSFFAVDEWGTGKAELEFSWINMDRIAELELYPVNAKDLLKHYSSEVRHFVYKEQ